jgi:DNA-binding winged helix-turn-helix (wHTH) protein
VRRASQRWRAGSPQLRCVGQCRSRNRVVSKDELVASIWGGRAVTDSALTTRINAVRAAVGDDGMTQQVVRTLARKGFRFVADVQEDEPPKPRADDLVAPASPALALPDKPSIINAALADDALRTRISKLGGTVLPGSPTDFGRLIAQETDKWAKVVKSSGVKPD